MSNDNVKFVLSIDGGGFRGLSCLLVLESLLENLGLAAENQSGQQPIRPCDIFDMICGTSTGGILAILLGRLGLTCGQAITEYKSLMIALFGENMDEEKMWENILSGQHLSAARFDRELARIVTQYTGNADTPMEIGDPSQSLSHTFVTVTKGITSYGEEPYPLRSYPRTNRSQKKALPHGHVWTIRQAARATTANPFYFDAFTLKGTEFRDSGLSSFNNPARLALNEARLRYGKTTKIILISLGTGLKDFLPVDQQKAGAKKEVRPQDIQRVTDTITKRIPNVKKIRETIDRLMDFAKKQMEVAVNTEQTHDSMYQEFKTINQSEAYFRFNREQGVGTADLADHTKEIFIREVTKTWMESATSEMKQLELILQPRYQKAQNVPPRPMLTRTLALATPDMM
jgi:predicted acylesterase/phospholipase RssA